MSQDRHFFGPLVKLQFNFDCQQKIKTHEFHPPKSPFFWPSTFSSSPMIQLKVQRPLSPIQIQRLIPANPQTMLNCIDNSGAALVECITLLRRKRPASVGDRIVVVVQKHRNLSSDPRDRQSSATVTNKVRRGDIRHAVVVRTRKEWRRKDGSYVRFDDNACVLINKAGEPIGTRLSGAVAQELREKGWSKIMSLAPAHV